MDNVAIINKMVADGALHRLHTAWARGYFPHRKPDIARNGYAYCMCGSCWPGTQYCHKALYSWYNPKDGPRREEIGATCSLM